MSDLLDDNQAGHEEGGKTKTYDSSTGTEYWGGVNWPPWQMLAQNTYRRNH